MFKNKGLILLSVMLVLCSCSVQKQEQNDTTQNGSVSPAEEALVKMNKSSKYKVIVPFYLAYKDMEFAPVPPFSNLIFELELIDFIKTDVR